MPSIHFATVIAAMVTDASTTQAPIKPLRKDAERNRRRILDAARELFAQRGLGVTLNDIAHHAGVGVGTVYRRFPDKAQLIESLFEQRFDALAAMMERALDDPDPWHGLVSFMHGAGDMQASDQALKELVVGSPEGFGRIEQIRSRLTPMGEELVRRAHAAGTLRDDVSAGDLPIVQLLVGAVIEASRDVDPELWRRYLQLLLRGMAADPSAAGPLPGQPLAPEQVEHVMTHGKHGHS